MHKTVPMHTVMTQRKLRLNEIRKLIIDLTDKHGKLLSALRNLEDEPKTQLELLNGIIDGFTAQIIREVENFRETAKVTIAKRVSDLCLQIL